jgi:hypothetical protein
LKMIELGEKLLLQKKWKQLREERSCCKKNGSNQMMREVVAKTKWGGPSEGQTVAKKQELKWRQTSHERNKQWKEFNWVSCFHIYIMFNQKDMEKMQQKGFKTSLR